MATQNSVSSRSYVMELERRLAGGVNDIMRRLISDGKVTYLKDHSFKKCTWDDPSRFNSGKGLSCWGSIINDVFAVQYLPDGSIYEQYQLAGPNMDAHFVPIPVDKINTLLTDANGKNPRVSKADGGKITLGDQLANAAALAGAARGEGVEVTLGLGDPDLTDMAQYKVVVTFNEFEDITNDDVGVEMSTRVRSYGSGSGAQCAAVLMGGFGTNVKVLQGDEPGAYGSMTTVRPSLDVDGVRHEFNLSVVPMVDASGKAVKIKDSGKETKESAMRAAAKGLSIELPVGPAGCKKITSTIMAIVPIDKMAPPPPEVLKDTLYMMVDPLSLDNVYFYKRTDSLGVYAPTSTVLAQSASAVRMQPHQWQVHRILNYTPGKAIVMPNLSPFVTIDPVNELRVYTRKWTDGRFHIFNPNAVEMNTLTFSTTGAPHYRNISGYVPAVPTPDQLLEHPEWAPPAQCYRSLGGMGGFRGGGCTYRSLSAPEEEDEEDEVPKYRSVAAVTPPAEAEKEEEEAAVVVDVADANPAAAAPAVEGPADASSDTAIAETPQKEDQAASFDKAPPIVGDKRSLSTSARDEPATNMSLTRQSRASKSAGVAPKIRANVKRSTEGCIVITETISVGLKKGTMPTEADILAIEALVGERIEAAKKAGGVSEIKKLSGIFAEKMGAVSKAPMSLQTKSDIEATKLAAANGAIAVGVPAGMEDLF